VYFFYFSELIFEHYFETLVYRTHPKLLAENAASVRTAIKDHFSQNPEDVRKNDFCLASTDVLHAHHIDQLSNLVSIKLRQWDVVKTAHNL
jgi:hypothetical protein